MTETDNAAPAGPSWLQLALERPELGIVHIDDPEPTALTEVAGKGRVLAIGVAALPLEAQQSRFSAKCCVKC